MSYSLRLKVFFLGRVIGLAVVTRLAFAGLIGLFGRMGGVADYAGELAILIAVFAAWRLTEWLNSYFARRTALRLLEEGFVKWVSQVEAQKSAATSAARKERVSDSETADAIPV
jgi:hypothetical protein